jgi:hypothetical protein
MPFPDGGKGLLFVTLIELLPICFVPFPLEPPEEEPELFL